jgi:uncharacterized protein (TIGR02145 family)
MKKTKKQLLVLIGLIFFFGLIACQSRQQFSDAEKSDKITEATSDFDISGLRVEVLENSVRIGNQEWMLRNLDVTRFQNGDPLFLATTNPQWQQLVGEEKPVYGHYGNEVENGKKWGLIYNWYALDDPRGLCPTGWRVPSDDDWDELINNLGGEEHAGLFLKHTEGWDDNGNGNNLSGFAALPGGFKGYDGVSYAGGAMARFWSATEHSAYFAFGRDINADANSVSVSTGYKQDGFSVRCIKE